MLFFFFKQKTAYEMRISDWSSDVCSSDLRPDHDLDRRVLEVHPGELGLIIFVRPERLGAERQEFLEAGVAGDRRRLFEELRRRLQPLLIFLAVRHGDELVALAAHHGVAAGQRLLLVRVRGEIGVELGLGEVGRIEARALRSEEHTSELQSLMRTSYA